MSRRFEGNPLRTQNTRSHDSQTVSSRAGDTGRGETAEGRARETAASTASREGGGAAQAGPGACQAQRAAVALHPPGEEDQGSCGQWGPAPPGAGTGPGCRPAQGRQSGGAGESEDARQLSSGRDGSAESAAGLRPRRHTTDPPCNPRSHLGRAGEARVWGAR